jgi:hypothetical protein
LIRGCTSATPGDARESGDKDDPTLETDTMAHNPVNHPLRPLYRSLAALAGVYLIVYGIVGIIVNAGDDVLATNTDLVLGQGGNLLWSILSLIIGAVVLIANAIGRNVDLVVDKYLGWAMLVIGSYGLATSRTDANFLGFTIATVIVTYLIGLLLILTSLYVKAGPADESGDPRHVREGSAKEEARSV